MAYKTGKKGFESKDVYLELCRIKKTFSEDLVRLQQKIEDLLAKGVDDATKSEFLLLALIAENNSKTNLKELKELLKKPPTFLHVVT